MGTSRMEAGYDMIYLAGCAANRTDPDRDRVGAMNLEAVYRMSRFCSLAALTYRALEPLLPSLTLDDPEVLHRWKEAHDRAFLREVRFGQERERVYAFLERAGIRYMPLKGIALREFYPECYLREMVDNDIFFQAKYRQQIRRWFVKRGYTAGDYRVGNCDSYLKKPIYNFEMHLVPFAYYEEDSWREYNKTFASRLIPDGVNTCRCHLSDEDFYVYMILHSYKHYEGYGIGVRSLLDGYLYTTAAGAGMDWNYVQAELSRFGVAEYEGRMRALSEKLFAHPETCSAAVLDDKERKMLHDLLLSGSHGTLAMRVQREIPAAQSDGETSTREKMRYVRRRLFPSAKYMASYAPVLEKHRWLIPAGYLYRFVRGTKRRGQEFHSEIKIVRKM